MNSPLHPINETRALLDQLDALIASMADRRTIETHEDQRKDEHGKG
jgi:hypothetical protein